MTAHKVKCPICNQIFDLNKVQGVRYNARRYAHYTCFPQGELIPLPEIPKEEKEQQELYDYIIKLFKVEFVPPIMRKQIKKYIDEYHYSYSGIQKSLYRFYEFKKNPIDKANGNLGIVPYVYQDAYKYFYNLYLAKERAENKNIESYKPIIKNIKICSPQAQLKTKKLFSFQED